MRAVASGWHELVHVLCSDPRVDALQGDCALVVHAIARKRADIVAVLLRKTTPCRRERLLTLCIAACTTSPVWRAVLAVQRGLHHLNANDLAHEAALGGAHEVLLDIHQNSFLHKPQLVRMLFCVVRRQLCAEFFSELCFLDLLASVPVTLSLDAVSAAWKRSEACKAFEISPLGAAKRASWYAAQRLPHAFRADAESWFVEEMQVIAPVRFLVKVIEMLKKMMRPRFEWIYHVDATHRGSMEIFSRADFDAGVACLNERLSCVISILKMAHCA